MEQIGAAKGVTHAPEAAELAPSTCRVFPPSFKAATAKPTAGDVVAADVATVLGDPSPKVAVACGEACEHRLSVDISNGSCVIASYMPAPCTCVEGSVI